MFTLKELEFLAIAASQPINPADQQGMIKMSLAQSCLAKIKMAFEKAEQEAVKDAAATNGAEAAGHG